MINSTTRDHARGALVRLHAEQRHECLARQRIVDGHHAKRQRTECQPAEPPTDLRVGQPRAPLVGRAAERDARGELRDHQRHQGLPDRHDHPQPYADRPGVQQHVVIGTEDADRHRDERERDREDLKRAEGAFQLRFIAAVFIEIVGGLSLRRNLGHVSTSPFVGGGAPTVDGGEQTYPKIDDSVRPIVIDVANMWLATSIT